MTEVRLVEDGPQRYRAGSTDFEPGEVHDVPAGLAEHLLEKPFFEHLDAEDDAEEDTEFDVDEWLDQDYQERVDRVEDGDVDEHLDEIAEAETSDNVLDAVGVRRAELEG